MPTRILNELWDSNAVASDITHHIGTFNSNGPLTLGNANTNGVSTFQDVTANVTCSGATSSATNLIPAGAVVLGVTVVVTTLITGATTFTIGDGTTADKWGTGIGLTVGTGTTSANWKAPSSTVYHPQLYATAASVVLTGTGASFTAGVVKVVVRYYTMGTPSR